MELINQNQKSV